jgi:2-hydroxychromene-2-carboxylate isomerase
MLMNKKIEFFFDVGSPTAYLAWSQLQSIASRHEAVLEYRPILLGGLFKTIGNVSPITHQAKSDYMFRDIPRCAEHLGVSYRINPHFPINTLALMRGAVASDLDGNLEQYLDVVFPAVWAQALNMADPEVVTEVLKDGGIDVARIFHRIQEDDVKQKLIANTAEAAKRGVFGVPTMFVDEEMFFGQDRLDYVERALD